MEEWTHYYAKIEDSTIGGYNEHMFDFNPTPYPEPWRALAAAIVAKAAQDAMGGNSQTRLDACQFLTSDGCAGILEQLDFDPDAGRQWITRLEAGEIEPYRIVNRLAG